MTREEAKNALMHCYNWTERVDETYADCVPVDALKVAIEALLQPEIIRCKDCEFNRNENGTTDCDFHNFWCAYDDGYCNFGKRKGEQ